MGYKDYYQRTIAAHSTGLKYVVGGTGLGKTRGVAEVLPDLPANRKAVYVANRRNLLHALEVEINNAPRPGSGTAIVLARDAEVVFRVFAHFQDDLTAFRHKPGFVLIKKDRKPFQDAVNQLTDRVEKVRTGQLRYEDMLNLIEVPARVFIHAIQNQMRNAFQNSPKTWERWVKMPMIQALFPFIAFERNPEVRILLVTLHKLFYGFFDGRRKINGTYLTQCIMFADEFDFLERDLIDLIVKDRQIEDPFAFVATFYREYTSHKQQLQSYPAFDKEHGTIRERIEEIKAVVDGIQAKGIQYPAYSQFISTEDQVKDVVIFRTSHTVTSSPVYLYQTDRGFDIALHREASRGQWFYASDLFRPVASATERILTVLNDLDREQEQGVDRLRQDWFRHTVFLDQMRRITHFPPKRPENISPQGSLLQAGFSMYDIHYLDSETDPEQVDLHNYAIYLTPESFIRSLAKKNLVFALSATADIHRCVAHFDLDWLRLEGEVNVVEPTDQDRAEVSALNAEKASRRANRINVEHLVTLDQITTHDGKPGLIAAGMRAVIERAMQLDELGGGEDTAGKHRQQRLDLFFSGMLWAAGQPNPPGETQSHLFFLNTYHEVEQFFKHEQTRTSPFHSIAPGAKTKTWQSFDLIFADRQFHVVFYNAAKARQWATLDGAENEFNALFHGDEPVIIVTQFQSAGNGINLQYTLPDGRKRDFLNLYLAEVPYFYFDTFEEEDSPDKKAEAIKKNIWYMAKLHEAKFISQGEFEQKLAQVHRSQSWNNEYRRHPAMRVDQQRNAAAALIQALGRIEREWANTPDQTVLLSEEAYLVFERLLADEHRAMTDARKAISSHNLQQVLDQIDARRVQKQKTALRKSQSGMGATDDLCKQAVRQLLDRFSMIRAGKEQAARRHWEALRQAALRHDFADATLREYHGVWESSLITDEVYFNVAGEVIPAGLQDGETQVWRLNGVYHPIRANSVITTHFTQNGYEVGFNPARMVTFVPYFYQAILMGALGEEAIRALLAEQHIRTEEVPYELFEVADLKVAGQPWYIDCKNYTESTLGKFALKPDEYGYYHKFDSNYFLRRALEKREQIAAHHGAESRLMFINLASGQERRASWLRVEAGNFVAASNFAEADVVIIPGAVDTSGTDKYHASFQRLIAQMKDNTHA